MTQQDRERDLIRRLRLGDEGAAAELDRTYGERIEHVALRILKNPEDAEEVKQDVLLQATRRIGDFRGEAALASWLHRIAFNMAISNVRRSPAPRRAEISLGRLKDASEDPRATGAAEVADWSTLADDVLYRSELRVSLARAVARLPEIHRLPVLLRDVYGLSTEETCAALRLKPQTLKSRLHRARLRLRSDLADYAVDRGRLRAA